MEDIFTTYTTIILDKNIWHETNLKHVYKFVKDKLFSVHNFILSTLQLINSYDKIPKLKVYCLKLYLMHLWFINVTKTLQASYLSSIALTNV